jgi:hypothetical protein
MLILIFLPKLVKHWRLARCQSNVVFYFVFQGVCLAEIKASNRIETVWGQPARLLLQVF